MIKSNICIRANVYVREANKPVNVDRAFTAQLIGVEKLNELKKYNSSFPFTAIQDKLLKSGSSCVYNKNEISFGVVRTADGTLKVEQRCESTECEGFLECSPKKIKREAVTQDGAVAACGLHEFAEKILGIKMDDDNKFVSDSGKNYADTEEEDAEDAAAEAAITEQSAEEVSEYSSEYIGIPEPGRIITAPLDTHIILNSGPGTGKTYTIIQRLIYILENELCDPDEIYILCYTRSAKKVIETKIDEAVDEGTLKPNAKDICLLTFDSYATYFLVDMKGEDGIPEDLSGYDYNARIRLFNEKIISEDFEGIKYFIVDEIQDLVNERAEMVLKIIGFLQCGYLLAGDRCQSIYDYSAEGGSAVIDSVEFYRRAEELFPDDMQRYEITVNKRQCSELSDEAQKMREVLLSKESSEQCDYAKEVISEYSTQEKIKSYIDSMDKAPEVSTAILTRNNGEAEYISGLLCKKGILHTLNRGVNNAASLPRWIADVFWDYDLDDISKSTFLERFAFRCGSSNLDAELLWEHICKLVKADNDSVVSMPQLIRALSVANDIPTEFCEEPPKLVVSTIHKAKGSEFDEVILVDSNFKSGCKSAEEARVRYVALTRPKLKFTVRKSSGKYFKKFNSGRIIEIQKRYKAQYCTGINVGLGGDIDSNSFALGDFNSAVENQEYISENIKIFDKISAVRSADSHMYEIYHNGRRIAALSDKMKAEIVERIAGRNAYCRIPDKLSNFYVTAITSEILKSGSAQVPQEFLKSRICYGIRVEGIAKAEFVKRG